MSNSTGRSGALIALAAVVAIVLLPLVIYRSGSTEFGGADGQAADEVSRIDPDHDPWFEPLWSPPGGETESMLFALQAALGAGVVGYAAGVLRTRNRLGLVAAEGEDDESPAVDIDLTGDPASPEALSEAHGRTPPSS